MPATILESFDKVSENSDLLIKDISIESKSNEISKSEMILLSENSDNTNLEFSDKISNLKIFSSDSGLESEDLSNALNGGNLNNINLELTTKIRKEIGSKDSGHSETERGIEDSPRNQSVLLTENDLSKNLLKDDDSCLINNRKGTEQSSMNSTSCEETNDSKCLDEFDSPIKLKKKTFRNCLEEDDICNISNEKSETDSKAILTSANDGSLLEMDSPIKLKKKKVKNCLEDDDICDISSDKTKSDSTVFLPATNNDLALEIDSPIKVKKKKFKSFLKEDDSNSASDDCTRADINEKIKVDDMFDVSGNKIETDSTVFLSFSNKETDSPVKIKKKKMNLLEEDDFNSVIDDSTNAGKYKKNELDQKSALEPLETSINIVQEEKVGLDDLYDDEVNTEENLENEGLDSDYSLESSCIKKAEKFLSRAVKGKDLIRQSLSLPYFQMPKPDFLKYIKETDECLEKPLMTKNTNSVSSKQPQKITLKPTNTIVFEIGSSSMNKVKRFQKKVIDMMNTGSSSEDADKIGGGNKKAVPVPIGAERLSWKMKLLNDIAKKKEAVLKERNEMLEEVMENNEEEYIEESDNDVVEDDEVDIHFPVIDPMISRSENDTMEQNFGEIPKGINQDDSHTMFLDVSTNKDWENDKEIDSSPFCFSLPSFQPEGGFSKKTSIPSSSDFANEENLSLIRDDELGKDVFESSRIENSSLVDDHPSPSISGENEKFHGEVLTEEQLLMKERSIHGEMTADILDMCSGQFLDSVETPKTPPLTNISADEESDMDISEDIFTKDGHLDVLSDSDSDDELTFKRKVVKKRIRPISPIDEESRHGEEDTQVHPASVSVEMNSNFNFIKKSKDLCSIDIDDLAQNDSNENISHENSLVVDEDISKSESKQTVFARDYFEDEAELSGEEGSSDEDEGGLDDEDPLIFDDEELPANDEIRDQIGTLHLKHLLDDDDQMIREVKNHFLDEGDLHSDAARQRKFNWSFNPAEPGTNPDLSGSDNEEEVNDSPFQQDKLKWKQENADIEISETMETQTLEASFKVEVQKKISTHIVAQRAIKTVNKRPRNSFLDEEEAKKSLKKMKLDMVTGQGTRATKNFVFVESGGHKKRKISSHKNSIDSSVFDVI